MSDRNPTRLRNEKGNHYCMNCQQPVFTKTKFSGLMFDLTALVGLFVAIVGFMLYPLLLVFGLIPPIGYIFYWYFVKKPVCPSCNARHFESVTDRQSSTDQQPSTDQQSSTDQPFFDVEITETNSPVQEGTELIVEGEVENTGDSTSTQSIRLSAAGKSRDVTAARLHPDESERLSFVWETAEGDAGDYTATIESEDDADAASVSVVQEQTTNPQNLSPDQQQTSEELQD